MYSRLLKFINKNDLLNKFQFGFRNNHSTFMALTVLMENLITALDNGNCAIRLFLDFQKAFDTVDHHILLDKLHCYGVRASTHQNTLAKILPCNQYLSQNMYKNNNVDLHFYRYRWSFICREWFSAGTHVDCFPVPYGIVDMQRSERRHRGGDQLRTHVHFAEVPYTLVLGKEVKWDSEITTTWLTSGKGNVFDCIKRHQKW